jgi:hypothetical protein
MTEYVFLYRGGNRPTSPEEGQKIMHKWMEWLKGLADRGNIIDRGQPLEPTGKIVAANRTVTDGPFAEAKDVVGGFTLIRARDVTEAAELAKGCPALEYGGRVEVRPVMKLEM